MSRICGLALLVTLTCGLMTAQGQDVSQAQALVAQAEAAYGERDFTTTVDLANRILTQTPTNHVALYLRGSGRIEIGIVTKNMEMVRQGIADAREAIRHEGKGKAEYYLPYIYGMSHLSSMEGKNNHAKTAKTVADSVLEREDLSAEQRANILYQRAQAEVRLNEHANAESDLREAIKLSPQHMAAMMMLPEVLGKTKTPADAVAAFTDVVKAFPNNPLVYNNRGMYLQSVGRPADAVNDFNRAIQLDPKFIPAYINRGFAYLEAGDSASAEKALSQALTVDPIQPGALTLRATARMNQNKATEAITDYRKVIEIAPHSASGHADLGFAQFFAGDYASALNSFKTAHQIDKAARFLKPWILACEIRTKQYQQATYQDTIAKAADQRDWVDSLIMFQLGQMDATKLLKATHPTNQEAKQAQLCEGYYFIGMELMRRDRKSEAVAYWQQAAQRKLPNLSAYRGAVFALKSNGTAVR